MIKLKEKPLSGARVAFIFGPGNLAVDHASALVRGPERALLELGASVYTFTSAHHKESIQHFYSNKPQVGVDQYSENSAFVKDMVDFINTASPTGYDYILGYFYDSFLTPSVMECLRKKGHYIINYPLNLLDQENHFSKCLEFFDETWCAEEEAVQGLQERYPKKIRYVPMASDPFIFRPVSAPSIPKLLFVGSAYGKRMELLTQCSAAIPTTIAGVGYKPFDVLKTVGRRLIRDKHLMGIITINRMVMMCVLQKSHPIGDEEYVRLAAHHGVSIGFSDVRQEHTGRTLHKVRLREYDSTMTGLCHITKRLPEMERHFEDRKEVLLYDETDEIPVLLKKITQGDVNWRQIGISARKKALAEHTWTRRFAPIFDQLGGL